MMAERKIHATDYGFNVHETIRHLHTADLHIHTIPGETWTLSCERHKTLLVDVYTLKGAIPGAKGVQTWQCGRLGELLVRALRCNHRGTWLCYDEREDMPTITPFANPRTQLAETLEEDMCVRLRGGDFVFPVGSEQWRLTNRYFGRSQTTDSELFRLAERSTLGTPDLRMYTSRQLDHLLLEFLCQQSEFVERRKSKVLAFHKGGSSA